MIKVYLFLLCLLACSVLVKGDVETTHIDFAGTYQGDMSNLLTRVQKKVDVKYSYLLVPDSKHHQFPSMEIEFQLEFAQEVYIKYNIVSRTSSLTYLWTGVVIDGVENSDFRFCTGYHNHHANTATEFLWMQAGKHVVQVLYNTNSNYQMNNQWWVTAIFKVKYFKK